MQSRRKLKKYSQNTVKKEQDRNMKNLLKITIMIEERNTLKAVLETKIKVVPQRRIKEQEINNKTETINISSSLQDLLILQ